jgi:hypothetical protein
MAKSIDRGLATAEDLRRMGGFRIHSKNDWYQLGVHMPNGTDGATPPTTEESPVAGPDGPESPGPQAP